MGSGAWPGKGLVPVFDTKEDRPCLHRIAAEAAARAVGPPPPRGADGKLVGWRELAAWAAALQDDVRGLKLARRHARWERAVRRDAAGAEAWRAAEAADAAEGGAEAAEGGGALGGWWGVVQRTEAAPHFKANYTFPSYQRGWLRMRREPVAALARRAGGAAPPLFALDCEMVETKRSNCALISVAVVDADGKMVIDMMVRPRGEVTDFLTRITGFDASSLEGVTATRADAARAVAELLRANPGAVLVGHSLDNDLRALKLDYRPVIDTALVHSWRGCPGLTPGLAALSEILLERTMRDGAGTAHDAIEDAAASLALARRQAEHGPCEPLERPQNAKSSHKLFVYHLPAKSTAASVAQLFSRAPKQPTTVEDPQPASKGARSKTFTASVLFESGADADAAFDSLRDAGNRVRMDPMGFALKHVAMAAPPGSARRPKAFVRKTVVDSRKGARTRGRKIKEMRERRKSGDRKRRADAGAEGPRAKRAKASD